ncbi:MAG: hypothetical protein WC254_07630 [Candidatus Woesearchaeota archaeon]|jgi:hypothetical protein
MTTECKKISCENYKECTEAQSEFCEDFTTNLSPADKLFEMVKATICHHSGYCAGETGVDGEFFCRFYDANNFIPEQPEYCNLFMDPLVESHRCKSCIDIFRGGE